jgi:hypothetical protein
MISKRIKREFLNYCYRLCASLSAPTNYKTSKKKNHAWKGQNAKIC